MRTTTEIKTENNDSTNEVKQLFEEILDSYKDDFTEKHGMFADVNIYTDKQMEYVHNQDPSKGWTGTMSNVVEKKEGNNTVLLVTYDGAGYDYLSCNAMHGGIAKKKFRDALYDKFGDKYILEDNTNWAFQVVRG